MKVVELSGGVGGARMARGLAAIPDVELTVIVNVGDDEIVHGLHISADLDTVVYTMAGVEGPEGWGRFGDSFRLNEELGRFGVDNRFQLGDLDLALNLYRTNRLASGATLATVTSEIAAGFGVEAAILPATNDMLRTRLKTPEGWLDFQDYFVLRRNQDEVLEIAFDGADKAGAVPGAVEKIGDADLVVIAPSNPPLSIWPILAVDGIRQAIEDHPKVFAVSPLIGGRALKGPADRVMASLGLPPGNPGVVAAYPNLLDLLIIDKADAGAGDPGVATHVTDTFIAEPESSRRLAAEIIGL